MAKVKQLFISQLLHLERYPLISFLPWIHWKGFFKKENILADTLAGVTVALVLVPQAIAYAQLAGLPAQFGLYASLLPPAIAALFGKSSRLATGPTAIISLMTASALAAFAGNDLMVIAQYAALLALLVGVFQFLMGVMHLGVVVNFISHPVLLGFSNAAGIIIATSQLAKLFGFEVPRFDHYYQSIIYFLSNVVEQTHVPSLIIGATSLVVIFGLKRIDRRIPSILIALIIATVMGRAVGFEKIGAIVGAVPQGIPTFSIPVFEVENIMSLLSSAFVIAVLGFMEAVAITKSFAAKVKEKTNANQELIGQGLANMVSALSGAYPVAGSFSRSYVNHAAGARTGLASIATSIFIFLILVSLTSLLFYIPQTALAAVIIASIFSLINFRQIWDMWQSYPADAAIAIVTFVGTLYFAPELEKGILVGVLISGAYYIYTRMRPNVFTLTKNSDGVFVVGESTGCQHILIYRLDGSLFFADANFLEERLVKHLSNKVRYVVLDLMSVNYIDFSGAELIANVYKQLAEQGVSLILVKPSNERVKDIEALTEITKLGSEILYTTVQDAVDGIYKDAHKKTKEKECALV